MSRRLEDKYYNKVFRRPGIAELHSAFFPSRGARYNWAIPGQNSSIPPSKPTSAKRRL